jgi:hypothetical protein
MKPRSALLDVLTGPLGLATCVIAGATVGAVASETIGKALGEGIANEFVPVH